MTEMDTLTIVRRRLADGRTIADSYVRALVAQIDQLKVELIEAIERGNDWCDQAQKARAERDRLRQALERATDTLSDASLLDAWADARAALKETGHE
jgi:crotonobetainyl-CoA:carnitine CoA-transferase CaiB-like acyl-CoA transferase